MIDLRLLQKQRRLIFRNGSSRLVEQSKIWIPYQDGPYQLPLVDQVEKCLETRNCSHLSELTSTFRGNIEVAKVSAGGRRKTKGGYPEKKCCSFRFCPNYLPPLLPLIWKTCTTFFRRQSSRFGSQSRTNIYICIQGGFFNWSARFSVPK